jgi:hypothetical protein
MEATSAWFNGWAVPEWEPDRDGGYRADIRRYPSALRLLGRLEQDRAPQVRETDLFYYLRHAILPRHRRTMGEDLEPSIQPEFRRWAASVKPIVSWWKHADSWRSPRETTWYRELEGNKSLPHLEPAEFAQFRLPDDISLDADVVAFQAWCQGVCFERMRAFELYGVHAQKHVQDGLLKVHASPWIRFALAAPLMQPIGVSLPGLGFLDSGVRMQELLKRPYRATDAELAVILRSPGYLVAYDDARRSRKRGGVVNPKGEWYACNQRSPLGVGFRHGGARVWTKTNWDGPVDAFSASTGELVYEYNSVDEAADQHAVRTDKLVRAVQRGTQLAGYYWQRGD